MTTRREFIQMALSMPFAGRAAKCARNQTTNALGEDFSTPNDSLRFHGQPASYWLNELKKPEEHRETRATTMALASFDISIVPALLDILEDQEKWADVRPILWGIGPAVVTALIGALRHDRRSTVRAAVASFFGDAAGAGPEIGKEVLPGSEGRLPMGPNRRRHVADPLGRTVAGSRPGARLSR